MIISATSVQIFTVNNYFPKTGTRKLPILDDEWNERIEILFT